SGGAVEAIRLVAEDSDLESLVAMAVRARPELLAQSAVVREVQTRVWQERVRPWLPAVTVGYSAGEFGGGSNLVAENFSRLSARSDFTLLAFWNVQNLGVGNHGRVSRARA